MTYRPYFNSFSRILREAEDETGGGAGGTGGEGTPPAHWMDAVEDAELKAWAQNKGLGAKTPQDALNMHRSLEKLFGAHKAGRTVELPAEDATPEQMAAFYNRMGRPIEAKDYKLEVGEGADPDFVDWAKNTFHGAGLTAKQAAVVTEAWEANVKALNEAKTTAEQNKIREADLALKTEWGSAYENRMKMAAKAAQTVGFENEALTALENQVGYASLMKGFAKLAESMGEALFVEGGNRTGNTFGNIMTPEQARVKQKELLGDPVFKKRLNNKNEPGHEAAMAEWNKLIGVQVD